MNFVNSNIILFLVDCKEIRSCKNCIFPGKYIKNIKIKVIKPRMKLF